MVFFDGSSNRAKQCHQKGQCWDWDTARINHLFQLNITLRLLPKYREQQTLCFKKRQKMVFLDGSSKRAKQYHQKWQYWEWDTAWINHLYQVKITLRQLPKIGSIKPFASKNVKKWQFWTAPVWEPSNITEKGNIGIGLLQEVSILSKLKSTVRLCLKNREHHSDDEENAHKLAFFIPLYWDFCIINTLFDFIYLILTLWLRSMQS